MKKSIVFVLATVTWLCAVNVFAQDDSTRYIFGLPVNDDDSVGRFPDSDRAPVNVIIPVAAHELPGSLREVLEAEDQYEGWQDSTVYLQKNTGIYLVPIRNDKRVKIFGLNEKGDPVTYDETAH